MYIDNLCILHELNVVHKVYMFVHGLSLCVSTKVAACFFNLVLLSFVFRPVSSLIPDCSTCDQYMYRCVCVHLYLHACVNCTARVSLISYTALQRHSVSQGVFVNVNVSENASKKWKGVLNFRS